MARLDAADKKTIGKIEKLAESVLKATRGGKNPFVEIPIRSLANVKFNEKRRLIELGSQRQKRYFFNVAMAKKFMQTFLVSDACKELVEAGKTTSIRDLYYITKHTIGDTKQNTFEEQDESDPIIEDLEVSLDALREELHLFASRKGTMVGPLTLRDSGDTIDLRRMGSGGWGVPSIVEQNVIQFGRHEARYVLLIDKDPWGFYIYSVVKQGSINLAYESMRMAVPDARFVGLSSFDKGLYQLPSNVAIKMDDGDVARARQMLAYPWFQAKQWQDQIQEMVRSGVKFELEALSRRGISFITEEYLPKKLKDKDWLE